MAVVDCCEWCRNRPTKVGRSSFSVPHAGCVMRRLSACIPIMMPVTAVKNKLWSIFFRAAMPPCSSFEDLTVPTEAAVEGASFWSEHI